MKISFPFFFALLEKIKKNANKIPDDSTYQHARYYVSFTACVLPETPSCRTVSKLTWTHRSDLMRVVHGSVWGASEIYLSLSIKRKKEQSGHLAHPFLNAVLSPPAHPGAG